MVDEVICAQNMEISSLPIGLKNKGATCYLNALVQSLFFTPEFRSVIFMHEHENLLPSAIYRLFSRLYAKWDPDTAELIAAMQWSDYSHFRQQDISECLSVIFGGLETSKPLWSDINNIYQISIRDTTICKNCKTASYRKDCLMTLPVSLAETDSLPEGISRFLAEESLTEENMYFCENCNEKQEASRKSEFIELPKILIFSLKRFDFHGGTPGSRKKLNSKMTFPLVLDMNRFLHESQGIFSESITNSLRRLDSQCNPTLAEISTEQISRYLLQGESVYELFAVLVHAGDVCGGHYTAVVKNMEIGTWCKLDDERVSQVSVERLEGLWGGRDGVFGNAYILKYRKVGSPILCDRPSEFVLDQIIKERIDFEEKLRQKRETASHGIFRILQGNNLGNQFRVEIYGDETVEEFLNRLINSLCENQPSTPQTIFSAKIDHNQVRVRKYIPSRKVWTNLTLQTWSDEGPASPVAKKAFLGFSSKSKKSCFDGSALVKDTWIYSSGRGVIVEAVLEIPEKYNMKRNSLSRSSLSSAYFCSTGPLPPLLRGHHLTFGNIWEGVGPGNFNLPVWVPESPSLPAAVVKAAIARACDRPSLAQEVRIFRSPRNFPHPKSWFSEHTEKSEMVGLVSLLEGDSFIYGTRGDEEAELIREYVEIKETFITIQFNSEPADSDFEKLPKFDSEIDFSPETSVELLLQLTGGPGNFKRARLLPPGAVAGVFGKVCDLGEEMINLGRAKLSDLVNSSKRGFREAQIAFWKN